MTSAIAGTMPECLDHIVWACADLERGVRQFEASTGVTPRFGGLHSGGRTQNALVGLGPRRYFEILAPIGMARADDDAWTRRARAATEPHVIAYCVRSAKPLAEIADIAAAGGWSDATVAANGRAQPDGSQLRWQWLAPSVPGFGSAFPFFIDWLDSPHPADSLRPAAGAPSVDLVEFTVLHPLAETLRHLLDSVGCAIAIRPAPIPAFSLRVQTPRGSISL